MCSVDKQLLSSSALYQSKQAFNTEMEYQRRLGQTEINLELIRNHASCYSSSNSCFEILL